MCFFTRLLRVIIFINREWESDAGVGLLNTRRLFGGEPRVCVFVDYSGEMCHSLFG